MRQSINDMAFALTMGPPEPEPPPPPPPDSDALFRATFANARDAELALRTGGKRPSTSRRAARSS